MPKKKTTKIKTVKTAKTAKANEKALKIKDRRRPSDRRRGVIDAIFQRLVKRDILPDRRKGDRRAGGKKSR